MLETEELILKQISPYSDQQMCFLFLPDVQWVWLLRIYPHESKAATSNRPRLIQGSFGLFALDIRSDRRCECFSWSRMGWKSLL